MSLREWLIVIGALVILGVVIDGVRRMRRARLDAWEVSQGMGGGDLGQSPVDDDYNPELPTGGARVVNPGNSSSEPSPAAKAPPEPFLQDEPPRHAEAAEAVEEPPLSETPVPTQTPDMEPPPEEASPAFAAGGEDNAFVDDDGIVGEVRVRPADEAPSEVASPADTAGLKAERDDWAESRQDGQEGSPTTFSARAIWQRIRDGASGAPGGEGQGDSEQPASADGESTGAAAAAHGADERPAAGANRPEAKEVIVINVHCRGEDERFSGPQLKKLLEACGMEYGDLGIYHRHEEPDTRTPVQFSAASAVSPGTFHPEEMDQLQTPGISFFLSLPGPSDSIQAFDFMMETAQTVVRNLGGELKDENRSVMTAQTIEHCRQRIREFERKQRFVRN